MKRSIKRLLIGAAVLVAGAAAYGGWTYLASAPPAPTVADIAYGANPAQRFDLWKPAGKGPFPVVLTVHGGAFAFGDKRGHDGLKQDITALLSHGIAVASVNYRMSGEARFPAAANDVTAALLDLRRRAPSLDLDPGRIALWGKSAGANLVLLTGLAAGRAPIGTGAPAPVSAIVAMYPPTQFDTMDAQLKASACGASSAGHDAADSPESKWLGGPVQQHRDLARQASPLTYVGPTSPPVLVQAGTADCMVPHQQSIVLADALKKAGAPVRIDLLPGAKHIDPAFDAPANLAIVIDFLERAFAAAPAPAR
ncbi:alpha/beta hydrolase [Sphingomonas sp. HITSZ_GF]|uniref:alpha/beta hydrolase n=1 Tax=Sphingomonas sp. HITSZ_GF TaxID=3037247 RepID=UPI00240E20ED|nr:alpha/beta hydrolase [Sphingomonas sp. HITSZ_GF]MDG2533009.1 alpha/beta hydrolase [Sphingomonas sp. HITSZ_GF]